MMRENKNKEKRKMQVMGQKVKVRGERKENGMQEVNRAQKGREEKISMR